MSKRMKKIGPNLDVWDTPNSRLVGANLHILDADENTIAIAPLQFYYVRHKGEVYTMYVPGMPKMAEREVEVELSEHPARGEGD